MKIFSKISKLLDNDYFITTLKKLVLILFGILYSIILNRYLGLKLRGEFEYLVSIVALLSLAMSFGIAQSYPYFKRHKSSEIPNMKQKYLNVFFLQFIIYGLLTMVFLAFDTELIYILIVLLISTNVLVSQLGTIMLVENIRYRVWTYILNSFIRIVILFLMFLFLTPYLIYIIILLLIHDCFFIFAYLIKLKLIPHPLAFDKKFTYSVVKFGFFPMLTSLLAIMNYKIDIVILKQMVSLEEIGLYATGVLLASYAWLLPDIFKEVIFSRTSKNDSVSSICFSLRVSMFSVIVITLSILLLGEQLLFFLYGIDFVDAYLVTLMIFSAIPGMMFYKIISPLYTAKGMNKFRFYVLLLSVISNVILNFILIPFYGIYGAAFASVVSYSTSGIIFLINFKKMYNLRYREILFLSLDDIKRIFFYIFK